MRKVSGTSVFLLLATACEVPPVDAPPAASNLGIPRADPADVLRPPEAVLDSFVGCYEFGVKIDPSMGGSESKVKAELRKTLVAHPNYFELVLLPKPPRPTSWSVREGEAVFAWSTGYVGVAFKLVRGGAIPEALAADFADAGPKIQPTYLRVDAKSIPCSL